jgi:hypothetical protein
LRLHLFELEDLEWFPNVIRSGATDYLRFMIEKTGIYKPAAEVIRSMLNKSKVNKIIDLCSGGGGGIVGITNDLNKNGNSNTKVTLTDKYPNLNSFIYISSKNKLINYDERSIDAREVPEDLEGLRTSFSSFHHFKPEDAKKVLRDAILNKKPIAIFEGGQRGLLEIIAVLILTPILNLTVTPFIRPFKIYRLFFTYIIPLIPITLIWDGLVSMLRIYHPEEFLDLTKEIGKNGYEWKAGYLKTLLGRKIIYMTGEPKI